jgi:uncharacterized caspase-like protein
MEVRGAAHIPFDLEATFKHELDPGIIIRQGALGILRWVWAIWISLILGVVSLVTPSSAATRLALVIGNSNYQNVPQLTNPANDAALIASRLRALDFKTTVLTNVNLRLLRSEISNFTAKIDSSGPDSIAMIYFAGHGLQIDGTNYLVPVDATINRASDVVLSSLSVSDLLRTLELAKAKINIVILDACRDNPFKSGTRGFTRGLASVSAPTGSIVAYSTAPGQTAVDGDGTNSPYALALANNFNIAGVSLEDMFKKVRIEVNKSTNGKQVPWEETSLTEEIMLGGNAPKPTVEVPNDAKTTDDKSSGGLDARRAYLKAVGQNTVAYYDEFIQQYPQSEEAKQALKNMEILTDEQNWRDAIAKDTIGGFVMYLNLHANGTYVQEANANIIKKRGNSAPAPNVEVQEANLSNDQVASEMEERQGFDVYGFDYRIIRDTDYAFCQDSCRIDTNCKALTFVKSVRRCYLKNGADLLIRNADANTQYRRDISSVLRLSKIAVFSKTDIVGNDYANNQTGDFSTCLLQCENDDRCGAFSFTRKGRVCWLKTGADIRKTSRNVDSGIK